MKILVVDDEEILVKGIRFNLQNEGYEILCGSNGREAVQLTK
jgi:CheY-like chemotaxis protein